ncbi:DUF1772 domain-containing protein [Modestobacter sp. I12A-02628]|uniref:DUF1772 domain-containing protein n=1 Tax=Goekera deserti TaxID=2497753 RepID=A0A7K3WAK8_9ACTN|nr:DUF1772 domain-containing protein [Goekera deserti]MPQ99221.1 DUF1772 domain-containing protein [Goekera deserti]NDI47556.1 DUF1772 domain-containing protein [Goekera deserti]NEL53367.1 DUF1772 domain-containing protein [Goekera deserti]
MTLLLVHLVLVSAYAGFQWTVRGLVYPQFAEVPEQAFAGYERAHQRRVSVVVGPLFAGQGITVLWLLADRPDGLSPGWVLASGALLAVVLGVTALGAVPLHRRLDAGWDRQAHRALLRVDAVRLAAALANALVVLVAVLRG